MGTVIELKTFKFKIIAHVKASAISSNYKNDVIQSIESVEMSLSRYRRTTDIELWSKFIGCVVARVEHTLKSIDVADVVIDRITDIIKRCKL